MIHWSWRWSTMSLQMKPKGFFLFSLALFFILSVFLRKERQDDERNKGKGKSKAKKRALLCECVCEDKKKKIIWPNSNLLCSILLLLNRYEVVLSSFARPLFWENMIFKGNSKVKSVLFFGLFDAHKTFLSDICL